MWEFWGITRVALTLPKIMVIPTQTGIQGSHLIPKIPDSGLRQNGE